MEKQITITKVALNGGMFMTASYKEHLEDNDERVHPNVKFSAPVHSDLTKAFSYFTAHLALICEQITREQFIESIPEDYDGAVGYSEDSEMGEMVTKSLKATAKKLKPKTAGLNGTDEPVKLPTDRFLLSDIEFQFKNGIEAIKLSGEMELSTGDWIGIGPTPWIKINGDYKFVSDLFQLGELMKYETGEYIINKKYAPPVDPELPFPDGTEIGEEQY